MSTKRRARELEATRMRNAADEVRSTWPVQRWLREYADLLDNSSALVAALIAEGATIEEVGEPGYYDHHGNDGAFVAPGRYLVYPIPAGVEKKT